MSWLNSVSSFVSGAGASARKLVTSISQESDGKEVVTPNIEVSEESEGQLLNNSINYESDIGYWNFYSYISTPARTLSISGLKSRVLKLSFLSLKSW